MKKSFSAQSKSMDELKKLNLYSGLFALSFFIILFFFERTTNHSAIFIGDITLIFQFEFIWSLLYLTQFYFSKQTTSSSFASRRSELRRILLDRSIKLPIFPFLLSIIEYIAFGLIFLYPTNSTFWILRSISEVFLLVVLFLYVVKTSKEVLDIRYPVIIIILESIRLIAVYAVIFLFNSSGVNLIGNYFGLYFISIIVLGSLILIESEQEKYREFTMYKEQFAHTPYNYQPHSFTGFMAAIPDKLARNKFYLNLAVAILGLFAVLLFVASIILHAVSNAPEVNIIITIAGILVLLLLLMIRKSQSSSFEMMVQYSQVMDYFVARNSQLFDILQSDDPNQSE